MPFDDASARDPTSAPPPAIVDRWRPLVGEYGPEAETLVVFEKAGRLVALLARRDEVPLGERARFAFEIEAGARAGERIVFRLGRAETPHAAIVGGVRLPRRRFETRPGVAFRVKPRAPLGGLRREALLARPPEELERRATTDLVELVGIDPTLRLALPYATRNNFLGAAVYRDARAFLQRPIAEALARVHRGLWAQGLGLLIHDAYRPWSVTKLFWDAVPDEARSFVADPAKGSRHNRGAAVDLTLFHRETGAPVEMPSGFDEFSPRARADYPGSTARARHFRERLRLAMAAEGFVVHPLEWWHFDHPSWIDYPISNLPFDAL